MRSLFVLVISCLFLSSTFATTLLGEGREVGQARCHRFDRGDHFLISSSCMPGDIPLLEPHRMMDELLPLVEDVDGLYDTGAATFTALPATLSFSVQPRKETIDQSLGVFFSNKLIKVPTRTLAMQQFDGRTVYAALRDTSTYGICRKQNYNLAMKALDREQLDPGEKLNMNRDISKRRGRCQNDNESFLFGEGACGASTQLFRSALMNPMFSVTKRYAHSERRAGFYGDIIRGDDASMYQMSKQLEIQNIGDRPVYMRTRDRVDGNKVLLTFFQGATDQQNMISKAQTWPRSAELSVKTVSLAGEVIREQEWISSYRRINEETD